jgi:dTMP kinase
MDKPGLLITFEGGEGVGKSTHLRLLAARLQAAGLDVVCLREPGGTSIGEQLRAVLLDRANSQMASMAELLLYESARAQLVSEVIMPALRRGAVVLCDRFTDSTMAYQGFGRQMGRETVAQANRLGSGGLAPDRTVLLTDDLELALGRAREEGADRLELEGLEFHRRVVDGFRAIAADEPDRVRVVSLCDDRRQTAEAVFAAVSDLFEGLPASFHVTDEMLGLSSREQA